MTMSVKGVYRNGQIELVESPPDISEGYVIVTFLDSGKIPLAERGIDETQAVDLRRRLAAFKEDWDRPEMDVYDAPQPR